VRAATGVAQYVQTSVGRNPVEPGPQARALLEAAQPTPGGHHRLLQHVLGILHRAEHPVTVKLQFAPEWLRDLAEGKLIASGRPLEHGCCHAQILPFLGIV
jgi:hypothetical protein